MDIDTPDKLARIRELNDECRRTGAGGRIMLTSSVFHLPDMQKVAVLNAFRTFDKFDEGNDPHAEHDFVSFEIDNTKYFAKCDYYDRDERFLSDDPSDPKITKRVWVIMEASEY